MNKRSKIVSYLSLFCIYLLCAGIIYVCVFTAIYCAKESSGNYKIVSYLRGDTLDKNDIASLNLSNTTHVIFTFAGINPETLLPSLGEDEADKLAALSEFADRNYPDVKILLSFGGGAANDDFCTAFSTEKNRTAFAEELGYMAEKYSLDGFDIDWEYPGISLNGMKSCPNCSNDHAAAFETMRRVLGNDILLTAALPHSITYASLQHDRLRRVLDFVNVMEYDISLSRQSDYITTTNSMFTYHLNGYSKSQLVFGVPFYGRSDATDIDYYPYDKIMDLINRGEAELVQRYNYSYAKLSDSTISFDSAEQIVKKAHWVKRFGYGGVFCWHFDCNKDGSLLYAIGSELSS